MQAAQPAEILWVHIRESARYRGKPLDEAIIAKCRELQMGGATVFRGLEGYGETAEILRGHLVHSDRPIVVMVVDRAESIRRLISAVAEMMDTGLMAVAAAEVIRVREKPGSPADAAGRGRKTTA